GPSGRVTGPPLGHVGEYSSAGTLFSRRSRGVAWPNTRPCQGRERRFESGRDRHHLAITHGRRGGRARLKATVSKTVIGASLSWVRIPPSPPPRARHPCGPRCYGGHAGARDTHGGWREKDEHRDRRRGGVTQVTSPDHRLPGFRAVGRRPAFGRHARPGQR